ncbi:hypothetical protein LTS07_009708 [Exophiala sideris]|uniref:Uncharacterized protein n=1 Tax=Exophiala sideris TaxID=1016849 RepID=A0ABR0JBE8_9EURO|nr:hypothetical protein LTS07_009708 [Exophiala sideris]KAK5023131.1 hypothetical protein LTR13_011308 [Exophiala sideris]KAK5059359.1 hypothetical protein LTR69_005947 [Exophiala sideris]
MPTDKQTKANSSKPLTPALSSNFRNVKSPFTPRLQGSPSPSPVLSSRREPFVRAKSPGKTEQASTPLNNNITPRSGVRRSRQGTESPSTPAPIRDTNNGPQTRPLSRTEAGKPARAQPQGLGINSPRLAASNGPAVKNGTPAASVATVHRRVSGAKSSVETNKDTPSKFFHASEAKSAVGTPVDEAFPRGNYFVGPPQVAVAPLPSQHSTRTEKASDLDEKFIRADDLPQNAPSKRPPLLPHVSAGRPDTLTLDRRRERAGSSASSQPSPPSSPRKYKPLIQQPTSPRKAQTGITPSPPGPLRTTIERPKSTLGTGSISQLVPQAGHRKSISAGSATVKSEAGAEAPRMQAPQPLDLQFPPMGSPQAFVNNTLSPETLSPRSFSLASTNTVPTSVTSETDASEIVKPRSRPVSMVDLDSITSPVLPQNDGAANARRERKVLDLEISNSSLLAINKTLERELRKQSGELRRFRRLSRAGRLSLATTRTVSGQSAYSLDTVNEQDSENVEKLSDLDEGSDFGDFDDFDDEDDSLVSEDSSSLMSVSARARQRARDEKRLMQDLSRHHQLLAESQRLSSTIKRCSTITEDLIREGNKALEYRVGIGDVQIGGRVLNDDELDERGFVAGSEEPESRQGLLSPGLGKAKLTETQLWTDIPSSGPTNNRDSVLSLEVMSPVLMQGAKTG